MVNALINLETNSKSIILITNRDLSYSSLNNLVEKILNLYLQTHTKVF